MSQLPPGFVLDDAPAQGPTVTELPMSRKDQAREGRDISASNRDDIRTGIQARGEQRDIGYKQFDQVSKWSDDYNADPAVKSYRVAISQLAQALGTGDGPQADLALTYAFAKAMDPDSVVREAEQGMVAGSQPWLQAAAEKVKKQFGMDGAGSFTPEARAALRSQIINSVEKRARLYDQRREFYSDRAARYGINPVDIVGEHDALPFGDQFRAYDAQQKQQPQSGGDIYTVAGPNGKKIEFTVPPGASDDEIRRLGIEATRDPALKGSPVNRPQGGYQDSYLGQGMSGVNEGVASVLGAPMDLANGVMNLLPRGLNAVANTDLPLSENPLFGSQYIKDNMGAGGMIYDQSSDPNKQSARRVGRSIGAAAVPGLGGMTLPRLGASVLAGAGGGAGAATAQRLFPGNPAAEMTGELLGGFGAGGTMAGLARRAEQRGIEAAVPTVPQLKQQAGDLYQQAETRGVAAGPMQTQQLRDDMEATLRREGQLGPTGKITDADTNTTKAFNLIDQYAGRPMRPVEMDTVRGVIADGRRSMDASDQRLAGVMTTQFDDWARPMAPEFDQARDISSRYLQAQDLEKARELGNAGASQFNASGLENSLRTQYRNLDRAEIRGTNHFSPDVTEAIQNVNRGTPASNLARNIGRFAPTGPLSLATSVTLPTLGGAALGGPLGAAIGGTIGTAGIAGRAVANSMTNRAVDVAELVARNGGKIPQAQIGGPELEALTAALVAAESAKYLPEKKKKRGLFGR